MPRDCSTVAHVARLVAGGRGLTDARCRCVRMREIAPPTPEVLRARRYAARTRILVALLGGLLLAFGGSLSPHPLAAALGLGVILATGVVEATSYRPSLLRVEEPFSCLAGVLIVGMGAGRVNALDRSLVQGIEGDPMRRSLVAAMTGYASSTRALLVAEGVETDAELQALARMGVPLVQGYRLARPDQPWPRASPLPDGLEAPRERSALDAPSPTSDVREPREPAGRAL